MTQAGEDRVVALANYVRLRDPLTAEVAFAVADDYQGRGIGTRLLEQLAALARGEQGIERFVGEVMADNAAMIHVFESVGFEVARTLRGGEVEMTFPIAPTVDYASRVEARDHTAVVASLRPFFEPRSVAVLGASSRRGTIGGELFRNILDGRVRRRRVSRQPQRRARRAASAATAPSPTSPTRSTSPSSAFPAPPCSRRWSPSSTPECGRSA